MQVADWNKSYFRCFQIQNVFALCNLENYSNKRILISSKGMNGRPLYIQ